MHVCLGDLASTTAGRPSAEPLALTTCADANLPCAVLQLAAVLKRGLLKRSFAAWQQLACDRQWKVQLGARERQVALLEAKVRGYEKRPVQVGGAGGPGGGDG